MFYPYVNVRWWKQNLPSLSLNLIVTWNAGDMFFIEQIQKCMFILLVEQTRIIICKHFYQQSAPTLWRWNSVFMDTSSSIQCLWIPALLFSVYGHQLLYSVFMDISSSIQCLWTPALLCDYCYLMVSNWIEAFFLKKRMSKIVHNSTKLVFI